MSTKQTARPEPGGSPELEQGTTVVANSTVPEPASGVKPENDWSGMFRHDWIGFFGRTFGDQTGKLCIAVKKPAGTDKNGKPKYKMESRYFDYPGYLWMAASYINQNLEYDVYFCAQLLTKERRIKENVDTCNFVWADLDACPIDELPLKLTTVIKTSDRRTQGLWQVEESMSGIDAEELSRRIAYSHPLIDKTGYDLSQLLRVPWTFNHKYDPPQMVGVHEGTTTYRPEDFDRFPIIIDLSHKGEPVVELPEPKPLNGGQLAWFDAGLGQEASGSVLNAAGEPDDSLACIHAVYRMMELGWSDASIRTALRSYQPFIAKCAKRDSEWAARWETTLIAKGRIKFPAALHSIEAFWNATPILSHIRDVARSRMANPWATFGVSLARVIYRIPPYVVLPAIIGGEVSLNPLIGLVGKSGDGKDVAIEAAKAAIDVGAKVETIGVGSGEGIAHLFVERLPVSQGGGIRQYTTAMMIEASEIDNWASIVQRSGGGTLMPEMRKVFFGQRLGGGYANKEKKVPVEPHAYRLCVLTGIQPKRSAVLLQDSDGGTPQRWLWMPALDPDAPEPDFDTEPAPIAAHPWRMPPVLQELEATKFERYGTGKPDLYPISVCKAAVRAIKLARHRSLTGKGDPIDGHRLLIRENVAAGLALLHGEAEITDQWWSLAGVVMLVSDATRIECQKALSQLSTDKNVYRAEMEANRDIIKSERIESADVERVKRNTLKHLGNQELQDQDGWVAKSDLRKKIAKRDRDKDLDVSAVEQLVSEGLIEADKTKPGHGETGERYRRREQV